MPLKRAIKDLVLYVAIGIGFVGVVLALAFYLPSISHTWFMFIWATAFLSVFISKMYWPHRKSGKLWALLALLLIAHIGSYAAIFDLFPRFPAILLLITVPLEIMVVATIVKVFLNLMPASLKKMSTVRRAGASMSEAGKRK
jgi:hypothetical protein